MQFFSTLVVKYLRFFARLQLAKNPNAQVVAVTGSSGKSSTRQAIAAALHGQFKLKNCSFGNSQTGIPLDILGLKPHDYSKLDWLRLMLLCPWQLLTNWEGYEILLLEMGIDSPKYPNNMDFLLTIVRPHIGVFTSVSTVHGENFDPLVPDNVKALARHQAVVKQVAAEKAKLVLALPSDGHAVINNDSPEIIQSTRQTQAMITTFGTHSQSTVRISNFHLSPKQGTQITLDFQNTKMKLSYPKQLLSPAYAHNLAAALAVATALKVSPSIAIDNLQTYLTIPQGRMGLFQGINNTTLIDSTYNASFESMKDALQLLKLIKSKHKVAVLGDMREVGQSSPHDHTQILKLAKTVTPHVILIGAQFQAIAAKQDVSFLKANQAVSQVSVLAKPDTVFLFKGSQNQIFLEYLLEQLLQNPDDKQFLCRQSSYWLDVKNKFFN